MGDYPTGPPETVDYALRSVTAGAFIAVYCYWGFVVFCLTAYLTFKRRWLKRCPAPPLYMDERHEEVQDAKEAAFVPESDLKGASKDELQIDIPPNTTVQFQVYPI